MLKNKKKLRRLERNTPGYAVKTAQSLVLAGALVLGGAGMASAAAATIEKTADWTVENVGGVSASEALTVTSNDGAAIVTNLGAGNLLGNLAVTSDTSNNNTLELGAAFSVGGTVTITGDNTNSKTSTIDTKGYTLTVTGATTIADAGALKVDVGGKYIATAGIGMGAANSSTLTVLGTLEGNVNLTGAKGVISLSGLIDGDVTLNTSGNAADATLVTAADAAKIDGKLTVSKGLATFSNTSTITGDLTIMNASAADAKLVVTGKKLTLEGDTLVGSGTGVSAGTGGGIIELDNKGDLSAGSVKLFGKDSTEIAKLDLKGTTNGSSATITNLTVGGAAAFGEVAIAGNSANDKSTLTVESFTLGDKGKVTVGSHGVMNIKQSLEIGDSLLANTAAAGGIGVGANGTLQVGGLLTLTEATTATGASTSVDAAGVVIANTVKAYNTTDKTTVGLIWNGGTLAVLGDGTANALQASTLTLTGGTVKLGHKDFVEDSLGGTYTGVLSLANSTLEVAAGTWNLTNNSTALDLGANGTLAVSGGTLDLNLGAGKDLTVKKAAGLNLTGGKLNLTGNLKTDGSGTITMADKAAMTVSGNLTAAVNDGVVVGGTSTLGIAGNATITGAGTNGGVYVNGGAVSVTGLTDISTAGVLNVADGTYTTGSIKTIAGSGVSLVGDGTNEAKLIVSGGTAGTSVITADKKIKLNNLGTVEMQYSAVVKADGDRVAGVGTIDADGKNGALSLKGGTGTLTLAEYKALKNKLFDVNGGSAANGGILRLEDVQIQAGAKEAISAVEGVSVPGTIATVGSGVTSTTVGGTEVKGLSFDNASAQTFTVNNAGAYIALVGEAGNSGYQLVTNEKAGVISLAATNGGTLALGQHGGDTRTAGTLKANVQLGAGGGNLQVANGDFIIDGTITDASNAGKVLVAGGANLTTGAITLAQNGSIIEVGTRGSLTATAAASTKDVTLDGGTFKTQGAFDLTVAEDLNITNGGTLQSGKDLVLSGATIGNLNGANLIAAGNITATAKAFTAGEKGLFISAKELAVGTLDGATNGKIVAEVTKLTTTASSGNVNLAKDSSLTVTGAGSTIGGTLVLGAAGADGAGGSAATATFTKDLAVTGNVSLYSGSTLEVGEFKSDSTARRITVGGEGDAKGSSLIIDKLTSSASVASTFIADPANGDMSLIQVKSVDAANKMNDIMIADANGIVSFGAHGKEWAKQQLASSGSGAESVLVMGAPVTMGATGQILVGEKWDSGKLWDGTGSATAHALDVRGKSLIIADVTGMKAGDVGLTLDSTKNTVNIADTAALRLYSDNMKADQEFTLVGGINDTNGVSQDAGSTQVADGGTLTLKGGTSTNYMLIGVGDVVYNHGSAANSGTLTTSTVLINATSVLPKLSHSMGNFLDGMATNPGFNSYSENAGVRFVSRALDRDFIGINDPQKAAATIEGAAQMGAVAGVQISTIGAASVASSAVTTRTSFAQPLMDMTKAVAVHQDNDGTLSLDTGLNAGNGMKNGLGVWIMPLYQSNNTWGQKAENFKSGMSSDLGGIALGADYTINDMFRFGAAFNVGGGYAQSSGDFNETENRFNFWGVNLYGGWTMNNFGLSADVGYTSSFNAVEQDTPAAMAMGNLKADVTTSAWTAGLKGEYKFETSVVDIIPHVGVRYMGLTTDSYDVKSGGTVFGVEQDFQSIWTFPIGVAFSKTITSDSGWMFKPMVDLTVIPAAGDLEAKSKASIPGVGGQAEMKMQVVDYVTFDGGLGFEVGKDNLSFGLNYNIQASEHRTGHGVFGTLRYEF